jgi:hypothetical protein
VQVVQHTVKCPAAVINATHHSRPDQMMRPALRSTSARASLSCCTLSMSTLRPVYAVAHNPRHISVMRHDRAAAWCGLACGHARRAGGAGQRGRRSSPARDCWPSRRCVWPLSCWYSFPGSRPVHSISFHRPTPCTMRHSRRTATSVFVHPGDGLKFHLRITRCRSSALVTPCDCAAGAGGFMAHTPSGHAVAEPTVMRHRRVLGLCTLCCCRSSCRLPDHAAAAHPTTTFAPADHTLHMFTARHNSPGCD